MWFSTSRDRNFDSSEFDSTGVKLYIFIHNEVRDFDKNSINRKFESTEFETMRVNCTYKCRFYFYIMYYNLSNICNFRQIYLILMRFLDKIQKTENLRDQSVHLYLEVNSQSLDHKVVCFFFIC